MVIGPAGAGYGEAEPGGRKHDGYAKKIPSLAG